VFSIVAKTNKGRRYYYLREQRRIGDKVRPRDFYLGRMDAEVIPKAVLRILNEKDRPEWWQYSWLIYRLKTVQDALRWWKPIAEARKSMELRGRRTAGSKERRWLDRAPRIVAALELALESNQAAAKRKALAFFK
jgi:hypothetical protein